MRTKRIAILLAAVALAACGGGGGGNVQETEPDPERTQEPVQEPVQEQEQEQEPVQEQEQEPAQEQEQEQEPAQEQEQEQEQAQEQEQEPPPVRTTAHPPATAAYVPPAGAAGIARDTEYLGLTNAGDSLNWALQTVKAADAYARLVAKYGAGTLPGAGQRIAVIDSGIDLLHHEIEPASDAGRVSYTQLSGARREPYTNDAGRWVRSHGTAVSSLILASKDAPRRSDHSFHGIAHGAHLDLYGIPLGSASGPYDPPPATRALVLGRARAQETLVGHALGQRPGVVNMSFGYSGIAEQYLAQRADLETWLEPLLDRIKRSEGTIFVASAGNGNGRECARSTDAGCASGKLQATSPGYHAALPLWDGSGEVGKRWVAVVATDRTNALAAFSNRCGLAAKWCMAAPGAGVLTAYTGPNPDTTEAAVFRAYVRNSNGTSYATPLVSGGLAVVKQYFGDTLTMEQVLQRLYATADVTPDTVDGAGRAPIT